MVFFEAKFSTKGPSTAWKHAAKVQVYQGLCFTVRRHLGKVEGNCKYDERSDKLHGSAGKRSGLSKKVAAISKRKMNLLNVHIQTKTVTSNAPQTQPPYPSNSPLFIVSMSSTNEPTRRIKTRGGARDKIAKVMERVCSSGIAKGNPDQPKDDKTSTTKKEDNVEAMKPSGRKKATATKAANTAKKPQTTKKANGKVAKETDMVAKKALAAKLAQLEDGFLKKADISCRSHPHQWTGEVQGNTLPS